MCGREANRDGGGRRRGRTEQRNERLGMMARIIAGNRAGAP